MGVEAAQGSRLFSNRPAGTGDTLAFTAVMDTEVTRMFICNTTALAAAFRVYHCLAGDAPGVNNALFYDKQVAANDTYLLASDATNSGIQLKVGDTIYIKSGTGGALGFQAYGVTASIAPGM